MQVLSAEKYIYEQDNISEDFTVNGECSNCGECCSNCLPLTKGEITRIKRYIKENKIKPREHNNPLLKEKPKYDMVCPFRDNIKKICTIYEVRPNVCKAYLCKNLANPNDDNMKSLVDIVIKNYNNNVETQVIDMRKTFF